MADAEPKQTLSGDGSDLQNLQATLSAVFNDLDGMRSEKAQVVVDNLTRAAESMEAQHRRVMDLLRTNEAYSREAKSVIASVERRQESRKDLQNQIAELSMINDQLRSTSERLESELKNLEGEKSRGTEANERMKSEVQSLNEEIERMGLEKEDLDKEAIELEKERDHLEEDVRRLTRLKEEYLANLARFRDES